MSFQAKPLPLRLCLPRRAHVAVASVDTASWHVWIGNGLVWCHLRSDLSLSLLIGGEPRLVESFGSQHFNERVHLATKVELDHSTVSNRQHRALDHPRHPSRELLLYLPLPEINLDLLIVDYVRLQPKKLFDLHSTTSGVPLR